MATRTENRRRKCPTCGQLVDGIDNYCKRCGCVLRSGVEPVVVAPPKVGTGPPVGSPFSLANSQRSDEIAPVIGSPPLSTRRMRDNPWVVIATLFLVLGPFGLPMLWASNGFGRPVKVILTTVILGVGAYGIWYMYQAYVPLFDVLEDLNRV